MNKRGTKPNFNKLEVTTVTCKKEDLPAGYDFSGNEKVDKFLFDKAEEIVRLTRSSRLKLGGLFQEVYDKLSGDNHYNGMYVKWIEFYGFNKMTALRYRKRYNLCDTLIDVKAKEIVANMSDRDLVIFEKLSNTTDIVEKLENGMTREELITYIKNDKKFLEIENEGSEDKVKLLVKKAKKIHSEKLNNKQKLELDTIINMLNKFIETL